MMRLYEAYAKASRAITLTLSGEHRVKRDMRKHCADLHNVRHKRKRWGRDNAAKMR